jgi:DNA-directed RNA polymerase subunit RPC12/RpoP
VKDSNDKPPYRHWHTVCAACGKVTLGRPCKVPGDIEPIEHNSVIRCQHCEDTRQDLDKDSFLAPLSAGIVR